MATTPTQIRIDAGIKQEASALFSQLGLDMSSAVKYVPASMRPSRRTSFCRGDTRLQSENP